jgi:hypothetical protein
MTEQPNRNRRRTRDESTTKGPGADDARARKALDERWEAVRRWIAEDDDSCCRGID